jgi:protein SCO1
MNGRASHIVIIMSAFLVALLTGLGTLFFLAGSLAGPTASAIGGPFKLIDQNGKMITDRDMAGKPFLIFFGYTHCPDVCPTTLFDLSEVMRALGKDVERARILFITVDPERDTATAIKDYLSSFDPHLIGATGDPQAIDAVEKAYRVYAKKVPTGINGEYSMDHTAVVYLMDKHGKFVVPFKLDRKPEIAAAELRRYF